MKYAVLNSFCSAGIRSCQHWPEDQQRPLKSSRFRSGSVNTHDEYETVFIIRTFSSRAKNSEMPAASDSTSTLRDVPGRGTAKDCAQPVRIARLSSDDRRKLLALFTRFGDDDRRSRFAGATSDSSLAAYIGALDFASTVVFGAWSDGTLVAVVEGFVYSGGGQRCIEAAFATDPTWRRLGLAKRLYQSLAEEAAATGVNRIVASCEARNRAVRALLHATGALTVIGSGEVSALWSMTTGAAGPCTLGRAAVSTRATRRELSFCRSVEVTEAQTARKLFATLPHGAAYAHRLVPAMATGLLIATIESVCILELQSHLAAEETVVGTDVDMRHLAPALPGRALRIVGSGRHANAKAHFDVVVDGKDGRIATAHLVLAVVDEKRFASRLARTGR